jgi:V8-like Glu-specific endopeptidase
MAKHAVSLALMAVVLVAAIICAVPATAGARAVLEDTAGAASASADNTAAASSPAHHVSDDDDDVSVIDTPVPRVGARVAGLAASFLAAPPGTTARAYKQSDRDAMASMAVANGISRLIEDDGSGAFPSSNVQPSVCSPNSLTKSDNTSDCRIIMTWRDANGVRLGSASCSAFAIDKRFLGTAGHCVYNSKYPGGWAANIDVYCNGANTCNTSKRTTTVTNIITTGDWADSKNSKFDMAVVRTSSNVPGGFYVPAQAARNKDLTVSVTGYPGQDASSGCGSTYAGNCIQYTSLGPLSTLASGQYESTKLDWCPGSSGGSVYHVKGKKLIGVVSKHKGCKNFVTPQINKANVNANSCQGVESGVSLYCLKAKLPPA